MNVTPYLAYFFGIFVRYRVMPSPTSPPLKDQMLLGVPMALLIVSPMLAGIDYTKTSAFLTVVGYIMFHGMALQESASRKLKDFIRGQPPADEDPTLPRG
jgi:hypothetical protein